MKFKEYVDGVNKMLEEHPELGDLEMKQVERWDDEEVCLPWHYEEDDFYSKNYVYV